MANVELDKRVVATVTLSEDELEYLIALTGAVHCGDQPNIYEDLIKAYGMGTKYLAQLRDGTIRVRLKKDCC